MRVGKPYRRCFMVTRKRTGVFDDLWWIYGRGGLGLRDEARWAMVLESTIVVWECLGRTGRGFFLLVFMHQLNEGEKGDWNLLPSCCQAGGCDFSHDLSVFGCVPPAEAFGVEGHVNRGMATKSCVVWNEMHENVFRRNLTEKTRWFFRGLNLRFVYDYVCKTSERASKASAGITFVHVLHG